MTSAVCSWRSAMQTHSGILSSSAPSLSSASVWLKRNVRRVTGSRLYFCCGGSRRCHSWREWRLTARDVRIGEPCEPVRLHSSRLLLGQPGGPHFLGSNAQVHKSTMTLLVVWTNKCFQCSGFLGQHLLLQAIVLPFVAEQSLELSKLSSRVLGYVWVFGDTRVLSWLALSLRGFELALPEHGPPFHSGTLRGVRGCGFSTGE